MSLLAAALAVFALDITLPYGIAVHLLYLPILLATAWWIESSKKWFIFAFCGLLILSAVLLKSRESSSQIVFVSSINRTCVLLIGAAAAWMVMSARRSDRELLRSSDLLQRSQEQLQHFVEQLPAAVAMFDREMRYLAHSRRWASLSRNGHDPGRNLIGTRHYDEFPNFPERWKQAHRRALAGETVHCQNDLIVLPDGRREVHRWEVTPWHDQIGIVGGVLLLVESVTERTEIERQLRDSEAMYRSLVENIPQGVFRKDLAGRFIFVNRRFCEMLGKSAQQLLGTTDFEHCPADLAVRYRADDQRVAETKTDMDIVENLQAPDGSLRIVQTIKTPIIDESGKTVSTQGIFWDITEKNRAEKALLNSERSFRQLAEGFPDVVARYDREFRYIYVNSAVEKFTGRVREHFLGKTNAEAGMHDDLCKVLGKHLREVFDTGRPQVFDFHYRSPHGLRYFESRIVPEVRVDSTFETVFCIRRDVTERVYAKQQEELHLAEFAHLNRLSTVGGLVSEIAHEINQPLHAIVNYSHAGMNVLQQSPIEQSENLLGWINQILEQANRAAKIIRRAGRFARKTPFRRSTINLNEVVRDCLKLVAFDIRQNCVQLRCELADSLPPIYGDAIQIQQVIVNLVRNAVEAMAENPQDDRHVLIRTDVVIGGLQLSVSDNGGGLTSEYREQLFEPFYTTKPEGLGLGLAVCQSIAKAHHGRLSVEPNQDRGETFFFVLPVSQEHYRDSNGHS